MEDVNFIEKLTMAILRLLLILFNVLIIAFLIYRMVDVIRRPLERSKKAMILIGGTLLLLAPLGILKKIRRLLTTQALQKEPDIQSS